MAKLLEWIGFGADDGQGSHADGHGHGGSGGHGHTHGVIDASLTTTDRGVWAIKWCGSACKKDPLSGVIGVQKGPLISMS